MELDGKRGKRARVQRDGIGSCHDEGGEVGGGVGACVAWSQGTWEWGGVVGGAGGTGGIACWLADAGVS
eukprot:3979616-Prorocentrum_lima.AAC.1